MDGIERNGLPLHSNSIPPPSIRLFGKEIQVNPILESQTPPIPPSPTDTTTTSTDIVGDLPIPAVSAVSGLEDNNDPPQSPIPGLRRLPKFKIPNGFVLILGKLHPKTRQFQTPPPPPTGTTATSIGLVADQPIPVATEVNGPQVTDTPPQPTAPAPRPNARVRPRRNGTALDPNGVGITSYEKKGLLLWESNLWFPAVQIPGRPKKGLQIFLGSYLTKQEAQDVHDRAALKLFQTKGVVSGLNFHESRHAEFMEKYRDWNFRDFVWQFRRHTVRFTTGKSSMKGVAVIETDKGNLFEAKTTRTQEVGKVHYSFGKFESEEEAGRAYDRGLLFLHREDTGEQKLSVITNFRPSSYSESEILRAGEAINICMDSDP